MRAPVTDRPRERVLEELELGLAADERCAWALRPRGTVDRIDEPPGPQCRSHALQLEGSRILDDEACPREAVGGGPDQDLARPRCLLEAGRQVHRLTSGEGGLGVLDDELSGLDADSRLEPELDDRFTHGEGGAGGSLGIVLVRLRYTERGQHRVARELLHDASVQA